ncbi:OmpH family outer membrane protein [Bacteroidales bacterium OttesenSCG-928-A17]|nr:OmpH family outer membrane protein [Bacteroidales bacterium OttesenSCG-928-A17]
MFKKIALLALLIIPVCGFSQSSLKIGYFNYAEVLELMPETAQLRDSIQKQAAIFDEELKNMEGEYQKKYTAYMEQQDTLDESIKIRRQQEIVDMGQRAQNFQQHAQQSQESLYNSLMAGIQEKLQKAVQQVGADNGFTYIVEINSMWYVSSQVTDATPLVKQKLGIQ